jgi:hypothetical protein
MLQHHPVLKELQPHHHIEVWTTVGTSCHSIYNRNSNTHMPELAEGVTLYQLPSWCLAWQVHCQACRGCLFWPCLLADNTPAILLVEGACLLDARPLNALLTCARRSVLRCLACWLQAELFFTSY